MTRRADKRAQTERRLVEAVGAVLAEAGFQGLGVNAVAAQAGVDKVLIYRYFGDWPGLLHAYGESAEFWPTLDEVLGPHREALTEPTLQRVAARVFSAYARALRARPLTVELLAWECSAQNELTSSLAAAREQFTRRLFAELAGAGIPMTRSRIAAAALLGAAINYLVIRGRTTPVFGGVSIATDAGWAELEAAMGAMFAGLG